MSRSGTPANPRLVGLVVALLCGAGFGLLAAVSVPWQPVPGPPVQPVPVAQLFTPDQVAAAESYATLARRWSWLSLALSLAGLAVLGFTRLGPRLMRRLPGPGWLRVLQGVLIVELVVRLLTLPSAIAIRRLRLTAGLTTQSWTGWAQDLLTAQSVSLVATWLLLTGLLALRRRLPLWWPAVGAVAAMVLVSIGSFLWPVFIEPLYNEFTPVTDPVLRERVLALAEAEGVEVGQVLIADASRRTTALNAYVSGFGASRRVVLYDTLVAGLPPDQVDQVVAHELSHAAHGDVITGTALGGLGAGLAVGLLGVLLPVVRRHQPARTARDAGITLLPLLLALSGWAGVATAPVSSGISRQIEMRADVDALRATGDREAFAAMQTQLAVRSLADPTPPGWWAWWYGTHPGVRLRVAIAERILPDGG